MLRKKLNVFIIKSIYWVQLSCKTGYYSLMNVIYLKSWVDVNTSLIFLLFYTVYKDLLYYIHSDIYLGQVIWRS